MQYKILEHLINQKGSQERIEQYIEVPRNYKPANLQYNN